MLQDSVRVTTSHADGSVVVTLAGELDMASVPALRASLDDIEPSQRLVLDCAAVTFMDSSGLSLLVTLWSRLVESGGSLQVRQPSPPVRRVMELTGLHELIAAE